MGTGNYAKVHLATSVSNDHEEFAIKSVSKSKLRGNIKNMVRKEDNLSRKAW